jgi:hypothetical protein
MVLPRPSSRRGKDANTACPHCGEIGDVLYGRDIMPSVITANNIWVEFTSTIRAEQNLEHWGRAIHLASLTSRLGATGVRPSGHVGQARKSIGAVGATLYPQHIPCLIPTGRYGPLPTGDGMLDALLELQAPLAGVLAKASGPT